MQQQIDELRAVVSGATKQAPYPLEGKGMPAPVTPERRPGSSTASSPVLDSPNSSLLQAWAQRNVKSYARATPDREMETDSGRKREREETEERVERGEGEARSAEAVQQAV
eukprot:12604459-Alexandrium_andersonii.AAC.1